MQNICNLYSDKLIPMTLKNIFTTLLIILIFLTFYNCTKKETIVINESSTIIEEAQPIEENSEFCALVNQNYYDSTKTIINEFLNTNTVGTDAEKLDKLVEWFETYNCIDNAGVYCNSCIFVGPRVSKVGVNFIKNGQIDSLTGSILMYDTLVFNGFQ